jgi:hypothetical protein
MFQRIRKHLTPSTAIAFLALVFALTGGAFAASSHSGGGGPSQATLTASAAKAKAAPKGKAGPRGPAGAKGATGAAGPAGPAGSQGPAGAAGAAGGKGESGTNGTDGTDGTNGTSVTSAAYKGSECKGEKDAGSEFKSASGTTYTCNGKEGSPWTAGGILPSGKTETGVWAAQGTEPYVPISFALPVEVPSGKQLAVHFFESGEKPAPGSGCEGEAGSGGAEPGNLCVFHGGLGSNPTEPPLFLNTSIGTEHFEGLVPGAVMIMTFKEPGAGGEWVVTAPTE